MSLSQVYYKNKIKNIKNSNFYYIHFLRVKINSILHNKGGEELVSPEHV